LNRMRKKSPLNQYKMYGVENLKKAVGFGLNLTEQIEKAGRDGFTWTDFLGFIDEIFQIPGIIANGDEIGRELKDLTEAEKEELISYAVAEFDIPNDKVEAIVEDALKLAFTVVAMVVKWRTIKAEA
jgi:hypothetical protein